MNVRMRWVLGLVLSTVALGGSLLAASDVPGQDTALITYGTMHEAIGQQQSHGRVQLREVVRKPHFFGVAALEELAGEITIHDGQVTITGVDATGQLESHDAATGNPQATLLAGAYVHSWKEEILDGDVAPKDFDALISRAASRAGIDTSQPFVFTIEGEFTDLDYHVINGACPRQARLPESKVPQDRRPFEGALEQTRGTVVGIFAIDAVGSLTHPGTTTHAHVLFTDDASGKTVTAHVDRVGPNAGAILRLPQ